MDLAAAVEAQIELTPDASDEAVAIEVMKKAGIVVKAIQFVLPAVKEYVATFRRNITRAAERRAFPVRRQFDKIVDLLAERQALVGRSFALGDGRHVDWLKATVGDHEERIAFLAKLRAGIDATISAHEDAIRLIREHDVTCLAEIGEEVLV